MLIKPTLKTWRAWVALYPYAVFVVIIFASLFSTDWYAQIASGAIALFIGFLLLLLVLVVSPFFLLMSESWEIRGEELVHRFAYEVRVHQISQVSSFGPPVVYDRARIMFRGSRKRNLIVGDKVVDRMMFPYLYSEADFGAFLNELKRINPQISFEPSLAKKFWT